MIKHCLQNIAGIFLILIICNATAFAENQAAEKYRSMVKDGNYYIEYASRMELDSSVYDESMISLHNRGPADLHAYAKQGHNVMEWSNINPDNIQFANTAKYAKALFKDEKLYSFKNNQKAYVYKTDEIDIIRKNISNQMMQPNAPLNGQTSSLVINEPVAPPFISIFLSKLSDDEMNQMTLDQVSGNTSRDWHYQWERQNIYFKESTVEILDNKRYEVDCYGKRNDGQIVAATNFGAGPVDFAQKEELIKVYYANGELAKIVCDSPYDTGMTTCYDIQTFTAAAPAEKVSIPAGCKVYSRGAGDIVALTGKEILVEEY